MWSKKKGINATLRVKRIQERKVYLLHGGLASIGGAITKPLVQSTVMHTWVEIETENPDIWFCAQFGSKPDASVALTKHTSLQGVTHRGKLIADRSKDDPIVFVTEDFYFREGNITMQDVHNWLSNYNPHYHIILNNCQALSSGFIKHFKSYASENVYSDGGCNLF